MILSRVSIERPVLATMATVAIVLFGAIGYARLPIRELPDVEFPIVTVSTLYPGASPTVVEEEVTDRVEEIVNTIEGVRKITSASSEGGSQVTIEFELERDVDLAAQDVREKVASIRAELPPEIEEPTIAKLDLDAQAIMWVALTSTDRDPVEITEFADNVIKKRLERLPGVGRIMIGGSRVFAVRILLDDEEMEARGVAVGDVVRAFEARHVEAPSGRVEGVDREFVVETRGELPDVEAFSDLIIRDGDGGTVHLGDIARVTRGAEDERTLARFAHPPVPSRPSTGLGILKQAEANTVAVAEQVRAEVEAIRPTLPPGYELNVAFDSSIYIETAIEELQMTLVEGAILAALVTFLFLLSGRSTLIAAVAIPTSLVASFAGMYFLGFTLNNFTLLALTIAVGVVIDDAIIVLENAFRHREEGKSAMEAARVGTDEIAFAAMAATFSIVAVFVPVAFITGMIGQFFFEFGVTVAMAVLISLFVALTLIPVLCSRPTTVDVVGCMLLGGLAGGGAALLWSPWIAGAVGVGVFAVAAAVRTLLGGGSEEAALEVTHPVLQAIERFHEGLAARYAGAIRGALRVRWLVIGTAIVLLAGAGWLLVDLGKEFEPKQDKAGFVIVMKAPEGASMSYTHRYLRELQGVVLRQPEIETFFTAVGLSQGGPGQVNQGIAFVRLRPVEERQAEGLRSQQELLADLRGELFQIPGFLAFAQEIRALGGSRGATLQYVLTGPELEELEETSETLVERMREAGGFTDVDTDLELNKPELRVRVDRGRAADLGVSILDVTRTLRILLAGDDIARFKRGGNAYDVIAQLVHSDRNVPKRIDDLTVRGRHGLVPLSSVVTVEEGVGPSAIHRYNRRRSVTISANLEGRTLGEALAWMDREARQILPEGFDTAVSGQAEDFRESFASLTFALLLAIAITYMVLASQFDSFIHPFTVMLAIPLSLVGAVGTLWVTGHTLNIYSFIGIIVLFGLVTKNSILLVDYANQLRDRGEARDEAVARASRTRLRPILMTAISMVFGVLPAALASGAGAETRQPMGLATAGGMVASTLLTLFVVPVFYTLIDDAGGLTLRTVEATRRLLGLDDGDGEAGPSGGDAVDEPRTASGEASTDGGLEEENAT